MAAHFSFLEQSMATQIFKDGESAWVETERLNAHLQGGWSVTDPNGPAVRHPDVILPAGMGLENLSPAEQERVILKEMGIEDMSPLNPANHPQSAQPIEVIGQPAERQKRKYTKKAK
jgi:hypothetical protein